MGERGECFSGLFLEYISSELGSDVKIGTHAITAYEQNVQDKQLSDVYQLEYNFH